MRPKKSTTRSSRSSTRSGKARSGRTRSARRTAGASAPAMVSHQIGSVVGDSLSGSVSELKDQVTEQVATYGHDYLESAREGITEATTKLVAWGRKHPVKTVAAATALIAVSAFLYATLNGKAGQVAQQVTSKLKAAAGNG